MSPEPRHYMDEPDIGSGERSPGQHEVEKDVRSVHGTQHGHPLDGSQHGHQVVDEQQYADQPPSRAEQQRRPTAMSAPPSRILQSGTHLARMSVVQLQEGGYEAQVYVRLMREPEIAETYIPVGVFSAQDEAWSAAEERARRALAEHEF